jgi:hypothetical protein
LDWFYKCNGKHLNHKILAQSPDYQLEVKIAIAVTETINQILLALVGLPLTWTSRAANMECLKFGTLFQTDKNGETFNGGELGLHLQCPWRLTDENGIIVGNGDLYEQADETAPDDENFDWEKPNSNLRDVKLRSFISDASNIVKSATADKFGGLQISFENNCVLTAFPNSASKNEYNEYWRLLDFRGEGKSKHYVSTSNGFEGL